MHTKYSDGEAQQQARKLSVAEFRNDNVIGHLGRPLGTIVRVTGTTIDGDDTGFRADLGKTLLSIETVNGARLDRPFNFEFGRSRKEIPEPKPGARFDYYVHEWGCFDGFVRVPKELGIAAPLVANDGFHYRPQITIYKSNTEK